MKKIHSKLNAQEWSQLFSQYKSMGIFPDPQGQLTHKSLVGSCRLSNSSKLLCLFLLDERMKKIQSKSRCQSVHNNIHQFLRCLRGANSKIGDGIMTKLKLIQAFIFVLICKNEEDPFKTESTRVVTTFLPF